MQLTKEVDFAKENYKRKEKMISAETSQLLSKKLRPKLSN